MCRRKCMQRAVNSLLSLLKLASTVPIGCMRSRHVGAAGFSWNKYISYINTHRFLTLQSASWRRLQSGHVTLALHSFIARLALIVMPPFCFMSRVAATHRHVCYRNLAIRIYFICNLPGRRRPTYVTCPFKSVLPSRIKSMFRLTSVCYHLLLVLVYTCVLRWRYGPSHRAYIVHREHMPVHISVHVHARIH